MSKEELSPALDQSAAWLQWLDVVGDAEREDIADLLEAIDVTDEGGLERFSQAVMVALMRGVVSPPIATELRLWATTLFAAQASRAIPNALENGGTVTIAQTLSATIERQRTKALPTPSWDVYDAEPAQAIPAKKESS